MGMLPQPPYYFAIMSAYQARLNELQNQREISRASSGRPLTEAINGMATFLFLSSFLLVSALQFTAIEQQRMLIEQQRVLIEQLTARVERLERTVAEQAATIQILQGLPPPTTNGH
jgi:hypothetical protein